DLHAESGKGRTASREHRPRTNHLLVFQPRWKNDSVCVESYRPEDRRDGTQGARGSGPWRPAALPVGFRSAHGHLYDRGRRPGPPAADRCAWLRRRGKLLVGRQAHRVHFVAGRRSPISTSWMPTEATSGSSRTPPDTTAARFFRPMTNGSSSAAT